MIYSGKDFKINMQVIKKSNSYRNKRIAAVLGVAILLIGGGLLFASVQNIGPFADTVSETDMVNYQEPSEEQVDAGNDIKKQVVESEGKPNETSANGASESAPSSGTVTLEITNEPKKTDGKMTVKTLVQEVSSNGTCTLTLTKAGETGLKKEAGVQPLASSSTCKFAPIDVSSLKTGSWNLSITYKSDKSNGSTSQKVQL